MRRSRRPISVLRDRGLVWIAVTALVACTASAGDGGAGGGTSASTSASGGSAGGAGGASEGSVGATTSAAAGSGGRGSSESGGGGSAAAAGGTVGAGGAGGHGGAGGAADAGSAGGETSTTSSGASSSASSTASTSSTVGSGGGDAGVDDAGDGGGGGCVPEPPPPTDAPATLSATGLYADIATKTIAAGVEAYTPRFALWSDGAEKQRWIHLPPCTTIDTSDMDHWSFPIGTRLWKEFVVGGKRVETRLLVRTGLGPWDWIFVAYQWNAAQTEAYAVPDGVVDANGTTHDIPAEWECKTCHGHSPERVLGFGAVQLSHAGPGVTIASLDAEGRLSVPYAGYTVPGDALTVAALGYLHANCGHCHNETGSGVWLTPPYVLRLSVAAKTVAETGVMQTAVGVPVSEFQHPGITDRIAPGDVASSCVAYRMSVRGTSDQMPPFGTEQVDTQGLATIEQWIEGL